MRFLMILAALLAAILAAIFFSGSPAGAMVIL